MNLEDNGPELLLHFENNSNDSSKNNYTVTPSNITEAEVLAIVFKSLYTNLDTLCNFPKASSAVIT
jgi:hypothetical protein